MSRVLLVTQAARGYGEFRRPWVRALYRRYAARYRRVVTTAARRLAAEGASVVMLAARDFVNAATLPAGVDVRWYDEESLKLDPRELVRLNDHLTSGWWSAAGAAPELMRGRVWLPELLRQARGIVMQLEITEPFTVVRRVLDDVKPERVVLVSGASTLERLGRLLAEHRGLPVHVAFGRCSRARSGGDCATSSRFRGARPPRPGRAPSSSSRAARATISWWIRWRQR